MTPICVKFWQKVDSYFAVHRYQLIFLSEVYQTEISEPFSFFLEKSVKWLWGHFMSPGGARLCNPQQWGQIFFQKLFLFLWFFINLFLFVQSTNYAFVMNKSSKHKWMEIWMLFQKNMTPLCNNNSVTNQISAQLLNRTDWLLSAQQAYFLSDSCEV